MKVPSLYSISFHSDQLASAKHRKIKQIATELLELRNKLSIWTQEHLLDCVKLSRFGYLKATNSLVNHISSNFYPALQVDVYTAYSNRFNAIKHKMECKLTYITGAEYYKRDCKGGKKGTIKNLTYKKKETDVTKTVSLLAMYGELPVYKPNIQRVIDKFGIERLLTLAMLRRENVLSKYSTPVTFTKLTFRGRSRTKVDIVSRNRNKKSKIKGFVTISWDTRGEANDYSC